jgi:hypothetical protein
MISGSWTSSAAKASRRASPPDRPIHETAQVHGPEGLVRLADVFGALSFPVAQVRVAAGERGLQDAGVEHVDGMLLQHSQVAGQQLSREFVNGTRFQQHFSRSRLVQPGQALEQGCLADAVGAEQGPELPIPDLELQIVGHFDARDPDIDAPAAQHRHASSPGSLTLPARRIIA